METPKDSLTKIIRSLSVEEKRAFSITNRKHSRVKMPYFLRLYESYVKLLARGLSDIQIETELKKYYKRNPEIMKSLSSTSV